MNFDVLARRTPPKPFSAGTRIPWQEPAFSERMLREHLNQRHDRASRRFSIVDQQVDWIHQAVLGGRPGRILDLGCGPGLYTSRLARLGHHCVGIDFSPASIAYAQQNDEGLSCVYRLQDLRGADLGADFDAVLMLFGEFNSFAPADAESLLTRACGALIASGRLLLELPWYDYVRELGEEAPTWSFQTAGLFADCPHLMLRENAWHPEVAATTQSYFVFCEGGGSALYSQSTKAYTDSDLEGMLARAGFSVVGRYESLTANEADADFFGLVGEPSGEVG